MEQNGATRKLAEFISKVNYERLPEEVIQKAKDIILDQLGGAIACSILPWNRKVLEYVKDMGIEGDSTVIGDRYRTSIEYAALLNGTFGHGFELDDYCTPCGGSHIGCIVVPAALALGEKIRASGRDFLAAVAIGAEVINRVGSGITRRGIAARGFHPASVYGPFGAAAASAKLLMLDKEVLIYALGIAGSHSCGTTEYDQSGGDVKRLHAGIAAMAGIRAALLAKTGFTAPTTILEGKNGILRAFSANPAVDKVTNALGEEFLMLATRLKPYACCGAIIPQIDAVREIINDHPVPMGEIEEITIGVESHSLSHVGTVGPEPRDITAAQFSSHFSIGLTIAKGSNDFKTYYEAMKSGFRDKDVIDVAKKIRVVQDDECEEIYPKTRLAKVTIQTKTGKRYSAKVSSPKGHPENPLSTEELDAKFLGLANLVLTDGKAKKILETIHDLEALSDIRRLTELVIPSHEFMEENHVAHP